MRARNRSSRRRGLAAGAACCLAPLLLAAVSLTGCGSAPASRNTVAERRDPVGAEYEEVAGAVERFLGEATYLRFRSSSPGDIVLAEANLSNARDLVAGIGNLRQAIIPDVGGQSGVALRTDWIKGVFPLLSTPRSRFACYPDIRGNLPAGVSAANEASAGLDPIGRLGAAVDDLDRELGELLAVRQGVYNSLAPGSRNPSVNIFPPPEPDPEPFNIVTVAGLMEGPTVATGGYDSFKFERVEESAARALDEFGKTWSSHARYFSGTGAIALTSTFPIYATASTWPGD